MLRATPTNLVPVLLSQSLRAGMAYSLLALIACGGSGSKPAASEADTSSLETTSGSPDSTSSAAPSPSTTTTDASASAVAPSSSPGASDTASPAIHPVPGATGDIDGKSFSPKLAQLAGPVQKDGRVLILIHEGTDCVATADARAGDGSMMLLVPWKDGYKTALSALKRAKGNSLGEVAFVRQRKISTTFKPSGLVTIVSAPTQKDAIGKMKIDLQSGGYILAGDLDVKVCSL